MMEAFWTIWFIGYLIAFGAILMLKTDKLVAMLLAALIIWPIMLGMAIGYIAEEEWGDE